MITFIGGRAGMALTSLNGLLYGNGGILSSGIVYGRDTWIFWPNNQSW
jgi:hypothetical protein